MGAFNWVSGWLPSFGKSEVVWNDVVVPKLTHLYIPSIYEFIQVQLITRIGSATIHRGCNLQDTDNLPTLVLCGGNILSIAQLFEGKL